MGKKSKRIKNVQTEKQKADKHKILNKKLMLAMQLEIPFVQRIAKKTKGQKGFVTTANNIAMIKNPCQNLTKGPVFGAKPCTISAELTNVKKLLTNS